MGDEVEAGLASRDGAEAAVDEGHDRVEVGAGDGAECPNQSDEGAGSRSGVLEQLQADVVRREPAGHDPGPDDGDDQESGAEGFGNQATREIDAERAGPGLGLVGQSVHDSVTSPLMRHAQLGDGVVERCRSGRC